MKTIKLELLSMEELDKLRRSDVPYVMREGAARELAKRENSFYHNKSSVAQPLKALDYLY